ncbi:LutC/YkgG family protein [Segetibacter koreensis]|uniref:LutC/YkgG family protein n=1 Tax=Segetibacter koreensis TaxID=398037 RepID=UPI00035EBE1F|nr:LUD domain-containing protein [Segetibacter koreensis]
MKVSSSKENILKKIRQALANPVPVPFPHSEGNTSVFQPLQKELEIEFAENFTGLLGRFSFCLDEKELAEQLHHLTASKQLKTIFCNETEIKEKLANSGFTNFSASNVATCDASITGCELLIARTGSLLMSSTQPSGRTSSVYAPIHICIAYTSQLVYDIKEGLQILKEKYAGNLPSLITLATGPSRTADIEKTLVVGVHGPKEVYVFLVEG